MKADRCTAIVAFAIAAVTFVAWRQAGIRDPKGTQRRCISVGMKLTAGFGGLTCLMLITSAITIRQQAGVIAANSEARELAGESDYLSHLADSTVAMDDSVERFLIESSPDAVSSYNDAAATAKSLLSAVDKHVDSSERRATLASLSKDVDALAQAASDIVAATDERDARLACIRAADARGMEAVGPVGVSDGGGKPRGCAIGDRLIKQRLYRLRNHASPLACRAPSEALLAC